MKKPRAANVTVVLQHPDVWEHAEHHAVRYFSDVATLVSILWEFAVGERKTSESWSMVLYRLDIHL